MTEATPVETIKTSVDEKERKFLLKRMPVTNPARSLQILQYYKDGLRYRMTTTVGAINEVLYEKIRKEKVAPGHNKEINVEVIDSIEFHQHRTGTRLDRHEIYKTRHEYLANGKKFEIDVFHDLQLIMMEVEGVEMTDVIPFPDEIRAVMLCEVTGQECFDNYNLGG